MKKSKSTPIIPELTRSGYQAFFENFDDSWVFESKYPLRDDELDFANFIAKRYKSAPIFAVRRVESPEGQKMPDFIIAGEKVEQKRLKSEDAIKKRFKHAEQQGAKGVFIEKSPDSILTDEQFSEIVRFHAQKRGMLGYLVVKKNTASSRERIDGVSGGFTSAFSVIDESVSDLILLQNIKKVNDLSKKTLIASTNPEELGIKIHNPKNKLKLPTKEKTDYSSATYTHSEGSLFHNSIISQKHEKINIISPKLAQKPSEYWRVRSLQRTVAAERQALPYIRKLREEYARSSNRSIDNVRRIYENYFSKAGFDRQKLREIVPSGELSKYLKEVRKLGIELPDNYKYRVSREEFAQAQLWLEAKKLGVFENQISTELYSKIINQSFMQTFSDYGVNFAKLNTESMNQILNSKFHGENFSTRIWGRTDRLADELQAKLAFAVAKGQSWEKTSREIRERFGVSQSSAERLIRTETNYFENSAEIEAYDELGVKEFEFLAALDGRTSEICRHHHGKRFKVKDAKAGVNTPPLHPNCRSTVVAVVEGLERENEAKTSTAISQGSESQAESVKVKVAKPKPVELSKAIDFDIPELASFDKKLLNAQKQEAMTILKEYPSVSNYLSRIGGLKVKATNVRKSYIASVWFISSKTTGARFKLTSLNMAKPFYRSREKMRDTVKSGVDSGYFMPISEKYLDKYTISHEMGHVLENFLMIRKGGNAKNLARQYESDILGIAEKYSNTTAAETREKYMSRYGKSDPEEFFAEAFAGLRCGVDNPITEAMKEFLKEKF